MEMVCIQNSKYRDHVLRHAHLVKNFELITSIFSSHKKSD